MAFRSIVAWFRPSDGALPRRGSSHRSWADPLARVRYLHGQGLTDKGIAHSMGVSASSARKWRLELGLPPNGKSWRRRGTGLCERGEG